MVKPKKLDLQPMVRFLEVLPKSGDKELGLLKAHLVIEEVLTKIICKAVPNEQHIYAARLSFTQKYKIARALNELSHSPWVWQALKLLNLARNELSHNLTTEELIAKLELFEAHVKAHNPELFKSGNNERFTDFHMAAFATYILLASHARFDPANVKTHTILTRDNA